MAITDMIPYIPPRPITLRQATCWRRLGEAEQDHTKAIQRTLLWLTGRLPATGDAASAFWSRLHCLDWAAALGRLLSEARIEVEDVAHCAVLCAVLLFCASNFLCRLSATSMRCQT